MVFYTFLHLNATDFICILYSFMLVICVIVLVLLLTSLVKLVVLLGVLLEVLNVSFYLLKSKLVLFLFCVFC